jgi:hypothetical protein
MLEAVVKVNLWMWFLDVRSIYGSLSHSTKLSHICMFVLLRSYSPVLLNTHSLKVST